MKKDPLTEELLGEIFAIGKRYIPAVLPLDIKRWDLGKCFDASAITATKRKYRYVEGVARDPLHKGKWILHAWVTDGVHAFDPTWYCCDKNGVEIPIDTIYFGVEMPIEDVAKFMVKTGRCSVFANFHLAKGLAKKCIGRSYPQVTCAKELESMR